MIGARYYQNGGLKNTKTARKTNLMKLLLPIFIIALGYLVYLNYGCETAGAMGWEGKYCIEP